MSPTLCEGDIVFLDPRAFVGRQPAVGDVVVAIHPHHKDTKIIKRVTELRPNNHCYLVSDNADDLDVQDSRIFGEIPQSLLRGAVVSVLPKQRTNSS